MNSQEIFWHLDSQGSFQCFDALQTGISPQIHSGRPSFQTLHRATSLRARSRITLFACNGEIIIFSLIEWLRLFSNVGGHPHVRDPSSGSCVMRTSFPFLQPVGLTLALPKFQLYKQWKFCDNRNVLLKVEMLRRTEKLRSTEFFYFSLFHPCLNGNIDFFFIFNRIGNSDKFFLIRILTFCVCYVLRSPSFFLLPWNGIFHLCPS